MWLMRLWLKLTLSEEFYHLSHFEFFVPVKFILWISVNMGMFYLGKDVKHNSLDSKDPEGREERTQEWRMKQQK